MEQNNVLTNGSQFFQVILLLMDPVTRVFELIQLEFKLKAVVIDVLKKVPKFVTEVTLAEIRYSGLCDCKGKELYSSTRLSDVCTGLEVLIALPENFNAKECIELARPILTDENVIEMFESIGVDISKFENEPEIEKELEPEIDKVPEPEINEVPESELNEVPESELKEVPEPEPEIPSDDEDQNDDAQEETEEKHMSIAERMAAIKAQQKAFSQKGRSSETTTSSPPKRAKKGSLAAQRMASIKAQQEAFAQKGRPSDKVTP